MMIISLTGLMFYILQWNARILIANEQQLKRFINKLKVTPAVICIQETWFKPSLDFLIPGHVNESVD